MKLLSENQFVGNGTGCAMVRDLFENEKGERISVPKSAWFWVEDNKDVQTAEQAISKFPARN